MQMALCTLLLVIAVGHCSAEEWAFIVSGTRGYANYRHHADACHAYQILRSHGILEERIILMAYDDVASSTQNPFKGRLFNHPAPDSKGRDVYNGCNVDYKGSAVSASNFLRVLNGTASGKVLKSTKDDNVFVYYTGMGAPGLIPILDTLLYSSQLQTVLQKMRDSERFNKMVLYFDTDEVGSMFEDMHIPGIYAVTASGPTDSSYATYCQPDDVVNGTSLNTCLGDLFSVAWLEEVDARGTINVTLQEHFQRVKQRADNMPTRQFGDHVLQWGDLSFTGDRLSQFLGGGKGLFPLTAHRTDVRPASAPTNAYRASSETVSV